MATKVYKEQQRFNDKIVLGILGLGALGSLYGMFTSFAVSYWHAAIYFLAAASLGLIIWFLVRLRLKVAVTEKNIKCKMLPLQQKSRKIPWKEVESCTIVRTPIAAHWHGANLNLGTESWFSLAGRNGLSLTTKDGHHYFIGCKNIEALKKALKKTSLSVNAS